MSVTLLNIDFKVNITGLDFISFYKDLQEQTIAGGYSCYLIEKVSDDIVITCEPIDSECITLYNLMRLIEKIKKSYNK